MATHVTTNNNQPYGYYYYYYRSNITDGPATITVVLIRYFYLNY